MPIDGRQILQLLVVENKTLLLYVIYYYYKALPIYDTHVSPHPLWMGCPCRRTRQPPIHDKHVSQTRPANFSFSSKANILMKSNVFFPVFFSVNQSPELNTFHTFAQKDKCWAYQDNEHLNTGCSQGGRWSSVWAPHVWFAGPSKEVGYNSTLGSHLSCQT